MSIEEFYNDIKSKKKSVKNNELSKLYQRPVKETGEDAPKWQVLEPNWIHQADTLYMLSHTGYILCTPVLPSFLCGDF